MDEAPPLSAACAIYDYAVENRLAVIATMTMPEPDYERQPTLFGPSFVVQRQAVFRGDPSVVFLVASKDADRLKVTMRLASDSIHRARFRKIHRLIPRTEIASILDTHGHALDAHADVPWGNSFDRLFRDLDGLSARVKEGTVDIDGLFKAISDTQNPEAGRTLTFLKEAEAAIRNASPGVPRSDFDVEFQIPEEATRGKPWVATVTCHGGEVHKRTHPPAWRPAHQPLAIYEHGMEWVTMYGSRLHTNSVFTFCHPDGGIEAFADAKAAFLRRANLMMKETTP